jgi:hypothetical protein
VDRNGATAEEPAAIVLSEGGTPASPVARDDFLAFEFLFGAILPQARFFVPKPCWPIALPMSATVL